MQTNFLPVTAEHIQDTTQKDKVLKLVLEYCQSGQWPDLVNIGKELLPYYDRRVELSLENGII